MRKRHIGLLASLVMCFALFAFASTSFAAKPKISGSSFSTSFVGSGGSLAPTGVLQFQIDSKTFTQKVYVCVDGSGNFDSTCQATGTLQQPTTLGSSFSGKTECIVGESATHTAWWSGTVTAIQKDDIRVPPEDSAQNRVLLNAGKFISYGRVSSKSPAAIKIQSADVRSVFIVQASEAVPNVLRLASDNGLVDSAYYLKLQGDLVGGHLTGANACTAKNALFQQANYQVIDGPSNMVQWFDGNTGDLLPGIVEGTAANMELPPAAAVFDISGFSRDLGDINLKLQF